MGLSTTRQRTMKNLTTDSPLPWDLIDTPDQDYNTRDVDTDAEHEIYWAKDNESSCLLLIRVRGNLTEQFQKESITIQGISTDLRFNKPIDKKFFVLRLERKIDLDIFHALCISIIDAIIEIEDSSILLSVIFRHLRRWKAFLAGRNLRILSIEEQRGLFCEIKFLQKLLTNVLSERDAVKAWCGPQGGQQDFVYFDRAVEIKSLFGNPRNTVYITSEDQLESTCPNLYLYLYRISEIQKSENAISLNEVIEQVYLSLNDDKTIEMFSEKLAAAGYVRMNQYNTPALIVTGADAYCVEGDFPRLIRSLLPNSIVNVSYKLLLHEIARFKIDTEKLWN